MSQPPPRKPSIPLDAAEEDQCRTPADWARRYISKNPDEHALTVTAAYGASRWERIGPLPIDAVQDLQAALGAAGLTPEKLLEQRTQTARRRRERLEKNDLFRRMQVAEIISLPDRDLRHAALLQLQANDGTRRLSASGRRVSAAVMLDADVKNGGFSQYFHNSNAAVADEALAGLKMIGADAFADVAQRAIGLFRVGPRAAESSLEARDHDFAQLDREYHALLRAGRAQARTSDPVDDRLAAFLRAHLSELWVESREGPPSDKKA